MPTQQIPASPVVVGVVSRRHAKLLHHLFEGNGNGNGGGGAAPVKDLRIRRVVPPAYASPDPPVAAAAVPASAGQIQAQSTPPEPTAAAAAEDRERKPMLPRSKLVRDPGSFGYRRLLPFLNQITANNGSGVSEGKDAPSEPKVSLPDKELGRSDAGLTDASVNGSQGVAAPSEPKVSVPNSGLRDESVDGTQGGAVPEVNPMEPVAVEAAGSDREMQDDTVREEAKAVPADPAGTKPCATRCTRSKFVHQPRSFSYKRMLPFLMENDVSSDEELHRAKVRRVSEEDGIASGGSPEELDGAQVDRGVEEVTSISDGSCLGQIQSAVAEVSLDGSSTIEAQSVAQEQVLTSVADPISLKKGELTSDSNAFPAGRQCQLAVSEDSPMERDVAEAETEAAVEERASQSDEKSALVDSVEPLTAKAGGDQEMKGQCDSVKEQNKIVPTDLASSKPCLKRCTRSRFVPHTSSFSYKRMLPFLMENDISSQEGDMAKFQRAPQEKQLSSQESDVKATGDHQLSTLKDSAEACYRSDLERIVEEISSSPYENCLVKAGRLHSSVAEVSLDGRTAKVQKATPKLVLASDKDELSSDRDGTLVGAQCQLAVSGDLPKENNVAEAERIVEEKATKSDGNSVDHQSAVSGVSPHESDTLKGVTQEPALTSDGDGTNGLTSDKGKFLVKDQPQLCDSKLLQDNAELTQVQQCQRSESDVGLTSPTRTVMVDDGSDQLGQLERQDSVASLDAGVLDVGLICKPSNPCASDAPLAVEEVSSFLTQAELGLRKMSMLRPSRSPNFEKQCISPKKLSPLNGGFSGVSYLKKRVLSPKRLSPKKGILKRPGCKGICMCLECSVFRLRADRAFEFSRKQMQEADDIIGNLLEEVASLRTLATTSSGQQEQIEEACQRASRVEEVARERQRQMQADLKSHCKIPGPRVRFAEYVDEKMALSPCGSSRRQPPL